MKKHLFIKKLLVLLVVLITCIPQMWGAAKQRYIYVGISKNYQDYKDGSKFRLHVWGGTDGDALLSLTWIQDSYSHDGRNYWIYRTQVYDDAPNAQFKAKDDWWSGTLVVDLDGTDNNAIFFSDSKDGWEGQFQTNYQVESSASLSATSTNIAVGSTSTLTPSLSSNSTYNDIKSTSYSVTTNPNSGGSVNSSGVFSATKSGIYTVTATVTYNAKDFTGITKTTTATKDITVYAPITLNKNDGSGTSVTQNAVYGQSATSRSGSMPTRSGYGFDGYWTTSDNSGVKVIKENGDWKTSISGFTDGSGNWTCTTAQTLYAHWLATGYYLVGPFTNWEATISKFSGSPLKSSVELDKSDYSGASYKTSLKIRQVKANTASACNDVWFGKNDTEIGKGSPTASGLSSSGANIVLQVYYDGEYTFTLTESAGAASSITVAVPVVDQLQIYSSSPSGGAGIANHNWGPAAANKVSTTVTLSASATYQFKAVYDSEYWSKSSGAITRGSNSISGITHTGSEGNMSITTDVAGDYTFELDMTSSKEKVTVTYPNKYTVTYSQQPALAASAPTIDKTLVDGYIADGTTIRFTRGTINSGYTWKGWYDNTSGTGDALGTGSTYDGTVSGANLAVYACYTENDYTVTVEAGDGGSVADDEITGHKDTKVTLPTAIADLGYYFTGWTVTSGTATLTSASSATAAQINGMTAAVTVRANFANQWGLYSSIDSWVDPPTKTLGNYSTSASKDYGYVEVSLAANTQYSFKMRDFKNSYNYKPSSNTEITYANKATAQTMSSTAGGGPNQTIMTAAAGTYRFTWNITDKQISVTYPTSWQITIGQKTIYDPNISPTSDASTTGGNVTAEDNSSNTITSGKYVANSASVTFTAHPATGYAFKGWYSDAACSEINKYVDNSATTNTVVIDDEAMTLTLNNIGAAKTVYAKYAEIMVSVDINTYGHGTFKIDDGSAIEDTDGDTNPFVQVGVHTTHKVTIVSEYEGYYFSGWTLSPGSSCEEADKAVNFTISGTASDEDNRTNVTITGLGDPDKCTSLNFLRANFGELEKIHFRNNFDDGTNPATHWSNVYVYFDVSLQDSRVKTSSFNTTKNLHVAMTDSEYRNRWWAYVPRYVTKNNKYSVAFADFDYAEDGYKLWPGSGSSNHGHAVYREDYRSNNNLFVPYHVATSTNTSDASGNVDYYNDGYWMLYTIYTGVGGGYYVEERTGEGEYSGRIGELDVINKAWEDQKIQYSLRIDGLSRDKYVIFNEAGHKYKASSTITYANCTDVIMTEDNGDDAYFTLTPTAEGQYVITIEQAGDQMKMSVEYPVVAGDYVIENAYNDGSAKTTRSNVIKASSAGTKTRYSMYLNNSGSGTLKLRKCTSINGSGVPQWSDGDATNLSGILSDGDFTPGVYQFDVVVNTSTDMVSEIDSIRLYTGNFYIKTDAASGGWVAYKENVLDKNTVNFDRTSATYDNYMCKYFASRDCNIKSVIANDYCNQLSDTVKLDGIARDVDGEPFVPVDGTSIRFSYNSATNETKRAYLGASLANDFMNIEANATPENSVYKSDGTTNIYGASAVQRKFSDSGDWVYEMILKAKPGAKAGVTATYTDAGSTVHKQILVPIDNTLLDGTGSKKYSIRVVYDFKTNFMMSAFVLDGEEITEALSDFDMLWVRHKDDAAQEVILGTGGSMTNVRVIGAVEFKYDEMYWLSSDPSKVDLSSWTVDSRPYLKYFISFPFDVEMNSIFGLNQSYYGLDYVIQKYDGAKRAKDGLFLGDGDNYWVNMEMGDTLKANEGYCLILDNDYASGRFGRWWDNKGVGSSVYLYFPAMEEIASITATGSTVVPEHTCTIDRTWGDGGKKNHMNTDSHWNMIGSPLFCNAYIKDTTASSPYHMSSYYELNYSTNKWDAKATRETPCFKAMSSRFVQWYGTIGWTNDAEQNIFKAPRRAAENENYFAKIEVTLNNQRDYTYLEMIDGADKGFILREDMMKFYNSGVPQICTFAEGYDVAYNKLPVENTTVALGLVARKNGTYTFSMPDNFSGTVTLIDNFAQTRTNLNMENYEVYLNKGTINDRFELEINIHKVPTAIDGVTDGQGSLKDGKAHKFIMNDMLYILKDGVLYDARGNRVK